MLVLVTGAAGFVGHHLVRRLLDDGHQVRCFVHPKTRGGRLEGLPVEITRGDISDPVAVHTAVAGTDAVIHLVAIIIEKGGATFTSVNAEGTRHVVMACQKAGVKRLIHQSANGAAPNASRPYTHSKWLGEEAVRSSGLDYTILRPSVIYGEADQFLNRMAGIARMTPIVPKPKW